MQWLSENAGRKVEINVPQRGRQVEIMTMCMNNASQKLAFLQYEFYDSQKQFIDMKEEMENT